MNSFSMPYYANRILNDKSCSVEINKNKCEKSYLIKILDKTMDYYMKSLGIILFI